MLAIVVIIAAFAIAVLISGIIYVTCEDETRNNLLIINPEEDEEMFKPICYGAEGRDIMEIQQLLKAAGSTIKVNGKYTIGMLTAVKYFQKKNGLAVTGKIDLKTMNKLKTYAKPEKKALAKKPVKKAAK